MDNLRGSDTETFKMHEAYHVSPLLKLTIQIESIAAYDNNLLVGTRQGHLLTYNVEPTSDEKLDVQLMIYDKNFSKKAIQQLEVSPDYQILVSLTDNVIQVHDIKESNFTFLHQAARTKGATFFTLDSQKQTSMTGETSVLLRMCVAVKRKLQIYYWKKDKFLMFAEDINLTEIPRSICWCKETICVGFRGEYTLLSVNGEVTKLFPTSGSRSCDPCIIKVSDTTFALGRESQTVLVNIKGETEKSKALKWLDIPIVLAWDEPYILGLQTDSVEVQTLDPAESVQVLKDLTKVRFIIRSKQGLLYTASTSQVWCIHAVDITKQRKILLDNKQFHLALKLTYTSNECEEDKKEKIHQIQTLLAYDLFANKQFHESMKEFLKLGTDPYDVIRLFPDLLPQSGSEAPTTNSTLTERELETGLLALIEYLTEVRHKLQADAQATINARGNLNEKTSLSKSTQQLLQIIDTTLLKCYLQTNDALVAPLLRLNHCHLAETERTLKKYGKHNELIILYQTKGQHRRALELLHSEGSVDRTVTYLQHLGSEHMGLILEFADWVLNESSEEGLKIFIEDLAEVEALPRPRVLDFLLRSHSSVVIPYLEHVVHVWEDTNPLFHNALVYQYREKIMNDETTGEHLNKKLLEFLQNSQHYTPDIVLGQFPTDSLLEERAIILGRLGKHDQALAIYVRVLGDISKATEYCEKVFKQNQPGSQAVYVSLIKLILDPNCSPLSLSGVTLSPKTAQPDLEKALELLEKYATKINPLAVLEALPNNVLVSRIKKFLLVALHKTVQERRRVQLLKGLLYAEHLQCQETRLRLQSQSVLITELNVCPVCKKRFSNQSALVRYSNGDVVHYSCQDRKL